MFHVDRMREWERTEHTSNYEILDVVGTVNLAEEVEGHFQVNDLSKWPDRLRSCWGYRRVGLSILSS